MKTRQLLNTLMALYGENPNSLAQKLSAEGVRQPQIYKFVTGQTKEPKRSTLVPVAAHYNVPVEAFFSERLADELLTQMETGWAPKPVWGKPVGPPAKTAAPNLTPTAQEPTPQGVVTVERAFEVLALHLAGADATSKKQAAFQLASLAESPADHEKLAALFLLTTQPPKQRRA